MRALYLFLLIVFTLLIIVGCNGPYTLTDAEKGTAELGAREWAERSGGTFIACSGQDSDKDGYVTCTWKSGNLKDNPAKQEEILCSYKTSSRGCKSKPNKAWLMRNTAGNLAFERRIVQLTSS